MRKVLQGLVFTFCGIIGLNSTAQVVIDNTLTPQQLVQDVLVGQGVQVSNITFSGASVQLGYFDASNGVFPISEGIVMTTGSVLDIPGDGASFSGTNNNGPGDADMTTISGLGTNDAAILQFDFVPTGDSISFNFSFGSEEYPTFVQNFNDAFAFLISGPGFNGPYINNSENIALIPGTSLPVTIDNVNDVIPANQQYYVNNENGGVNGVTFNGYTTSIAARAAVDCGATYTLRFVIADALDANYDSGVFLEANSFNSNAVEIEITTASGSPQDGGGWIVEGCTPAEVVFERPATATDTTLAVPVIISGSAINGVDYTGVPDTVHFEVGDTTVSITIDAIDDLLTEPNDSIVLTVYSVNLCGDTTISTGTIHIYDTGSYIYSVNASDDDVVNCAGDSVLVTATAELGNPDYTFNWSNGLVGDSIWITPDSDSLIYVTSEDACGTISTQDSVLIEYAVSPPPEVNISGPEFFNCIPQEIDLSASATLGLSPYTYQWGNGSSGPDISVLVTSIADTSFVVTATDACGVQSEEDTITLTYQPLPEPEVVISGQNFYSCIPQEIDLSAVATSGLSPYTYDWNNGDTGEDITVVVSSDTAFSVIATDFCGVESEPDTIEITFQSVPDPEVTLTGPEQFSCIGDELEFTAMATNGVPDYTYNWSNGDQGEVVTLEMTSVDTLISVTATDACGNVSLAASIEVEQVPPVPPIIQVSSDVLLDCPGDVATLSVTASGGVQPYSYVWSIVNETTSSINVQPADTTTYVVTVSDDCFIGVVEDSVTVNVVPYVPLSVNLSDTMVKCSEDPVLLTVEVEGGNPPIEYDWNTGADDESISENPEITTTYTVTVSDQCDLDAQADATVEVPVYDPLVLTVLSTDLLTSDTVTICELWSDTVWSEVTGGLLPYDYTWFGTLIETTDISNDSVVMTVPFELPSDSNVFEVYSLTVIDDCMQEVMVEFPVNVVSCDVFQPGIFNPNSDFNGATDFCGNTPQNNVFELPCLNLYPGNTVTIWDRWGRKCYQTENYHLNSWDGGSQATGTYYYVCEIPGDQEPVKGFFQLVR